MLPGVIGKLVIWEESSWNNLRTHDAREEIESTISAVAFISRVVFDIGVLKA